MPIHGYEGKAGLRLAEVMGKLAGRKRRLKLARQVAQKLAEFRSPPTGSKVPLGSKGTPTEGVGTSP